MACKILLICPEKEVRQTLRDRLETEGYQVSEADSQEEALKALAADIYPVILADLDIPGAGPEIIKTIREINADSRILAFTGKADLATGMRAVQESADDLILKPADWNYLRGAVRKAEEKYMLQEQNRNLLSELVRVNKSLNESLARAAKETALISHDLSVALMTLKVSYEMLAASMNPSAEQKKKMESIGKALGQAGEVSERLERLREM